MIAAVLLLFLLDDSSGQITTFSGTDIYKPLRIGDVAVGPDGQVFIVNFDEASVVRFDSQGERMEDIGTKGQGPGEFQYPGRAFVMEDKLYVLDFGDNQISVFDAAGKYLEKNPIPGRMVDLAVVKDGWIYGNWSFDMDPEKPVQLYWADHKFENSVLIDEWPRNKNNSALRIESDGSGVMKVPYSPVRARTRMVSSPKGDVIYISDPNKVSIRVIDVETKKVVRKIKRTVQPIPFNEDWGLAELKKMQERRQGGGMQIKFEPDFPEYFPVIRDLFTTHDGQLVVSRWSGDPDKQPLAFAVDREGKDISMPYKPEHSGRIMAVDDGWVYISTFSEDEEEAGLIKCRPDEVDQVVANHPINFSGFSGRLIMKMN